MKCGCEGDNICDGCKYMLELRRCIRGKRISLNNLQATKVLKKDWYTRDHDVIREIPLEKRKATVDNQRRMNAAVSMLYDLHYKEPDEVYLR